MSLTDQKRSFHQMKHYLEPMRSIILRIDSLLSWEKNYYPALVGGCVTVFYLLLWYLDMSTITILSLMGLITIVVDFLSPSLSGMLSSGDVWSGNQEAKFENIVEQLFIFKTQLIAWYEYIFTNKEPKSAMIIVLIGSTLLFMAWVGAIINNYFLMYIITLTLLMYPGMKDKAVLKRIKEKFCDVCSIDPNIQDIMNKKD